MPRRFRAPAGNGAVLADPGFDAVPALVEANRRLLDRDDIRIGGLPLRELRALARCEVLELARDYTSDLTHSSPPAGGGLDADAPLLIAGHQPELSHPGVWVKNFALNGLARKVGGIPLNLIVDNDTLKSTAMRVPVFTEGAPASVHTENVAFDRYDGEKPYEERGVADPVLFGAFARRVCDTFHLGGPLLCDAWPRLPDHGTIGERFTALRTGYERRWGCENLELPVSRLARTSAFSRFAAGIAHDPLFGQAYNATVHRYRQANHIRSANHPVPDLQASGQSFIDGGAESPFWVIDPRLGRRGRLFTGIKMNRWRYRADDWELDPDWHTVAPNLRPRALTLTLFARVCLGDFFIHGIGGGMYDEVTDDIIRHYFGLEPPAYQVLSATLHLPLPGFPATAADARRAERHVRDLHWNPQRHLSPDAAARPDVAALVREKERLAAAEPPYREHAARRAWFRDLAAVTEMLRPFVWKQVPPAKSAVTRTRAEADANAMLRRRDYSWVLYPEDTLKPFLQRFLEV